MAKRKREKQGPPKSTHKTKDSNSALNAYPVVNGWPVTDWSIKDMNFDLTPYCMALDVSASQSKMKKKMQHQNLNHIGENENFNFAC